MPSAFAPVGSALPPRRDTFVTAADAAAPPAHGGIIIPAARDRFLELIEREQLPQDVRGTLAGALSGDIRRQQMLFQAMLDTWPRLQKCIGEVKRAARKAPWRTVPWAPRSGKPNAEAENLAKEVEAAMWGMKPDPVRGRRGFEGTVEALVEGYYLGHQVQQIYWTNEGAEYLPLGTKTMPPRYYGYPWDMAGEDRLMLDREGGKTGFVKLEDFPKNQFLVAVHGGHPGHASIAAPLRALTGYWLAAIYGLKWFMQFAQLFGQPIRWAEYAAGDATAKAEIVQMMQRVGTEAWGIFPVGTKLNFVETGKSAASLPQHEMLKLADEQCEVFILGQTLTSSQGDRGSQSLGTVHMEVRQEVIEGVCDFVGEVFSYQFVPAYIDLNYGEARPDAPGIWAVFEEAKDEKALAERDRILVKEIGMPVGKAWLYERHGVPMPAAGEEVFEPAPPPADPVTDLGADPQQLGKPAPSKKPDPKGVEAGDVGGKWLKFAPESGTLGIPRAEMPQIRAENRGAMVSFLRARGVDSRAEEVNAVTLRPTQAEYSPARVATAAAFTGGQRSILVSQEGHVVDGHHQWLAAMEASPYERIRIIRLMAPIRDVLAAVRSMPSATVEVTAAAASVDQLSANVLEGLTGVTREWLSPVRPFFDRLAALSLAHQVTDDDFLAALQKARGQLPELFDVLDTRALQNAFEDAIGSALLDGSSNRYE